MNKTDLFSTATNAPLVDRGTWSPAGGALPSLATYPRGSRLKATTNGTISGIYYKVNSFITNTNGVWTVDTSYNYADLINTPNAAALFSVLGATTAGQLFVTLNTGNSTQQSTARTNLGMSSLGSSLSTSANKAAFYATLTLDTDLSAKENISNKVQNLSSPTTTTYISTSGLTTYFLSPTFGTVSASTVTITGQSTLANLTTSDPVVTIGGNLVPVSDDAKSKGIEFRWHNGTIAKLGFFGFDRTSGNFKFIPDATNTSEVLTGTVGTIESNLLGNVTGNVTGNVSGTSGSAATLTTGRTISLTGDVVYTSGSFNGSGNVTGTATLAASGVTAATYKSVTVNAKGLVTAGTNPTTLAGFGITDAQATLVSGTNIKTVNGISVLGSGNVLISGFDGNLATNLNFTTSALRITGDFSDAIISNRTLFQSSISNSATRVEAIPNGTATTTNFGVYNNADPTNSAGARLTITSTEARIESLVAGTGTALPLSFFVAGLQRATILTNGNFGIANFSPAYALDVTGTINASTAISNIGSSPRYNSRSTSATVSTMTNFTSYQDNTATEVGWLGYGAGDGTFGINNSSRLIKLLSPTQFSAGISGNTTVTGSLTATAGLSVTQTVDSGSSLSLNTTGSSHTVNFQTAGINRAYLITTNTGISFLDSTTASKLSITTAGVTTITASNGNNSTLIATTAFVQTALSGKQNLLGFTPLNKVGDTMTGTFNGRPTGSNNWFTYQSATDAFNYGTFYNSAGAIAGYIGGGNGAITGGMGALSLGLRAVGTLFFTSDADDIRFNNKTTHYQRSLVRVNSGATPTYATGQLELTNNGSNNPVVLGFHAEGVSSCSLVHISAGNGLELHSGTYGNFANFKASNLEAVSNLVVAGTATISGIISGNGSGLTNLPAANLTGTINSARLPFTVSTSSSAGTVVQRDGSGDIYFNNAVGTTYSGTSFLPSLNTGIAGAVLNSGLRWTGGSYSYGISVNSSAGGLEYHACQSTAGEHRFYTGTSTTPVRRMTLSEVGNLTLHGGNIQAKSVQALGSTTSDITENVTGASDFYSGPSYAGVLNRFHGSAVAGTIATLPYANLGMLLFQNVANSFITTNGSHLHLGANSLKSMRLSSSGTVDFYYDVITTGSYYGNGSNLTGVVQKATPVQIYQSLGTVSGTVNINAALGTYIIATVNGNTTFNFPAAANSNEVIGYTLELNNGGSYTISFNSGTLWKNGTQPTLTTGKDILVFTKAGTNLIIGYDPTKNIS